MIYIDRFKFLKSAEVIAGLINICRETSCSLTYPMFCVFRVSSPARQTFHLGIIQYEIWVPLPIIRSNECRHHVA